MYSYLWAGFFLPFKHPYYAHHNYDIILSGTRHPWSYFLLMLKRLDGKEIPFLNDWEMLTLTVSKLIKVRKLGRKGHHKSPVKYGAVCFHSGLFNTCSSCVFLPPLTHKARISRPNSLHDFRVSKNPLILGWIYVVQRRRPTILKLHKKCEISGRVTSFLHPSCCRM